MLNTRVFRRHYLITAMVIIVFVVAGHFANLALLRMNQPPRFTQQPLSFARLIRELDPKDPVRGLAIFDSTRDPLGVVFDLSIADRDGFLLYPPSRVGERAWEGEPPNLEIGEMAQDPPPSGLGTTILEAFGRPPPLPRDAVVRLYSDRPLYLLSKRTGRAPDRKTVAFSIAILLTSILGGAGVALMILFRSLRLKATLADDVLAELQSGNLKARFPIDRMDEIGQTMLRFNRMADEIERLVDRLRTTERSRMQLLQELGHDLRTPVASLKNMLETLATKGGSLDPKVGRELMDLSLREVDYFERLIEDLLVLAQIGEPNYRVIREPTDLAELVDEEIELLHSRRGSGGSTRRIDFVGSDAPIEVSGDAHLLRRAVRNALENAFDFSKKAIRVEIGRDEAGLARLEVRDDGPGFSPEQLAKFGERRMTRTVGTARDGRISIGLGSVIMKTILDIHRGSLEAENWRESDGRTGGARVVLRVPAA